MRQQTREVLVRRFPECLVWLEAAPVPARIELLSETPEPLLRIDGIQLAGAYDAHAEALLQARLIPAGAKCATVYGLAHGDLPRALLAREELDRLRVVILNASVARTSLAVLEHADWLADPRVELVPASAETALQTPFVAAPAALRLADAEAWRLRDLIVLELATPYVQRRLRERTGEFAAHLDANRSLLSVDDDVAELFGSLAGRTVRIAAAGPTLSDHYERLRQGEHPLVAVDAALKPLLTAGVVPDFVVSIEGNEAGLERLFDVPADGLTGCALVYFPVSPPRVLARWPGRRLTAYGESGRFETLRAEAPRGILWSSGSVTHAAVDLAVRMGARRVELFGADFATPRGRTHVQGMPWGEKVSADATRPLVQSGRGHEIPSMPNLLGYLRDLEGYVERHPEVDFVNAGRDGALIRGVRYEERDHAA